MAENISSCDMPFILLKASDVAKMLNISRSLAYQLLQKGEIPTIRFGGTVRVRPKDLMEFIEQRIER